MKRWSVSDVMTKDVVVVREETPYKEVVEILDRAGVSAAPVVDADARVVGVVSEADLLYKVEYPAAEEHQQLLASRRRRIGWTKATADTARDLMSSPAVVTTASVSIAVAAKAIDEHRVRQLPVVDEFGRLVGIVARSDLLRVFLRTDDAVRDEIIEQVLVRTLWIEPETIAITVERGVAVLSGTVDRRSTVGVLHRLVEAVPGVVEVADHLTYHYDDTEDLRRRRVIAGVAG
jgi:CBS-domain-containing membrane protein